MERGLEIERSRVQTAARYSDITRYSGNFLLGSLLVTAAGLAEELLEHNSTLLELGVAGIAVSAVVNVASSTKSTVSRRQLH